MLSNDQIEDQDYTTNQVADLKMRLDISIKSLEAIAESIRHEKPHEAYALAVNDLARITGEHAKDCNEDVQVGHSSGLYECSCMLINPPVI